MELNNRIPPLARVGVCFSVFLCICASGCAGMLKQAPVAKSYFAIDPGAPEPNTPTSRPSGKVLLVRTLRVSPPYDGLLFVYRIGPSQFDADYYNNFIAPPAALLTGAMIRWLSRDSGMTVCDPSSELQSDLILEGNVTDLYIDSTQAAAPRAVVGGRFFLTRQRAGSVELIMERRYEETAPVVTRSAAGFASAWGQAYRRLLADLTRDLRATGISPKSSST